jgi:steroid delta-isomerase-like uncharacterized protein
MPSNIDGARACFSGFNDRDFDAAVAPLSDDFVVMDFPSGQTMKGREEFKGFLAMWAGMATDGQLVNLEFYDADDRVTCEGAFAGTNDGPFGTMPATGKAFTLPLCCVWQFNADGQILSQHAYYDLMGLMVQLGHVPAPA